MKFRFAATVAALALICAAPASAELKFKPGEDARFNWANFEELKKVDLKGETLTIFRPWRGDDEKLVTSILAYFSEATAPRSSIPRRRTTSSRSSSIRKPARPPNIAVLPQPGLLADLASKGRLVALSDADKKFIEDNYGAGTSWAALGTYKDKDGASKFFAFPYKADVKSLVWYSPENFKDAGYEIPKTMEELIALQDKIVKDGGKPWCIGLGSGGATGWPATDWVEEHHAPYPDPRDL